MPELKYQPVTHDHAAFLEKARTRPGFTEAFEALALVYSVADQVLNQAAHPPQPVKSNPAGEP